MSLEVVDLRCEYLVDPMGIDELKPRFSWRLISDRRGAAQSAFRLSVERIRGEEIYPVWDSGKVPSAESTHVVYEGADLVSTERYRWKVCVWDERDRPSAWSRFAYWEMGLLDASEWAADWISPPQESNTDATQPVAMLRREFRLGAAVSRARLYVTSLGLYELHVNGSRVGDALFRPGWTSYQRRLQYQVYDVTDQLKVGGNAMGMMLGDGWYRGNLTWEMRRNVYGDRLGALAELRVEFEDGGRSVIPTDLGWKTSTGPILMSDIYLGETYDARLEWMGWTQAGFDDADWKPVEIIQQPRDVLVGQVGPSVRRIQEISPVAFLEDPDGKTIVDFGQNLAGWIRLSVSGKAGDTVVLRHAEILDRQGYLYTENLRAAKQEIRYTLSGTGDEVFEPHFTFQGFRYVEVEGYPGALTANSLTAVVIHSEVTETGSFSCSNADLNQLVSNVRWSQKGNFVELPTDCPQRCERLGWTGDAQVFVETAAYNMDVAAFFTKWLLDLAVDQRNDGSVPHVIPDVVSKPEEYRGGATGWADAAVIVPWILYRMYGDERVLERQYESMTAWIANMRRRAGDDLVLREGEHFGDWLSYQSGDHRRPSGPTDPDLLATAHFAYSTRLVAETARALGRMGDASIYEALALRVKEAFIREFVTPAGRVSPSTQTAYVLAIAFDLLPDELREIAARRLVDEIRRFDNHLTTGFLGTPRLPHVLTAIGRDDVAYDLLLQDTYPSWLYPVRQGATTIWERWDGIKPDGSFQDAGMNSYNHYAYGAVGAWLYGRVAGIRPDETAPGFKHVIIAPQPGGGLTWARAEIQTMYGKVLSSWRVDDGRFTLEVYVPPNATATVVLPAAPDYPVTESGESVTNAEGVTMVAQDERKVELHVVSGAYRFETLYELSKNQEPRTKN